MREAERAGAGADPGKKRGDREERAHVQGSDPGGRWRRPWTLVGRDEAQERSPGRPPEEEREAEKGPSREKTPSPPPKKQAPTLYWQAIAPKTDKPRVTAKVRSRKFIQKRGLRKVELCQKDGTLSEKKSCQKTDSISPSQISKTQPQPLPQPVSKSSLPKIYPKTGAKKSRALSKRGDAFRKKSAKKRPAFPPSQT